MQATQATQAGRTSKQYILLIVPPVLILVMYLAYQGFVAMWGAKVGYFAAFSLYWIAGCLLLPLWILGRDGVLSLFQRVREPLGQPLWLGATLLIWPPLLAGLTVLPVKFPQLTFAIVAGSAGLALVNATLEEVLWRGAYIRTFPQEKLWGWIYPSIGFSLWHIAPLSVHNNPMPGGMYSYLLSALVIGLSYGWVAWRTGSIRWTVASHVLMNFLGMGATLYFAP
jgi:membrane protease YdiL (CAAX protease family)